VEDDRDTEAYVATVVGRVRDRLAGLASGGDLSERLGPPDALAEAILALVPEPSPWTAAIGPVYRTDQVRRLLGGMSRQALADRVRRRTILALHTADGRVVYPTYQFRERAVVRGLSDVLKVFEPAVVDPWTLAAWLHAGQAALGGSSVVAWLLADRPPEQALAIARSAATRWAA
jgi:hypothetical protein